MAPLQVDDLGRELAALRTGLTKLGGELRLAAASGEGFAQSLGPFAASAEAQMAELDAALAAAREGGAALAAYFGEPPGDAKAEEIVRTLHAFCQSFAKAQADNARAAAREARLGAAPAQH